MTYERLLLLPLFQGMTMADMHDAVATTKFLFKKYSAGKVVAKENDALTSLCLLLDGTLMVKTKAHDGSYSLTERLLAPNILQPERLFGFTQRYTKTFQARTTCHFVFLGKDDVLRLIEKQEIFRLNLLNMISTQSQRAQQWAWRAHPADIRSKILRFVEQRASMPAGEKTLTIKMETLATLLAESRLNVSRELHRLQERGLIKMGRSKIVIPNFENLYRE